MLHTHAPQKSRLRICTKIYQTQNTKEIKTARGRKHSNIKCRNADSMLILEGRQTPKIQSVPVLFISDRDSQIELSEERKNTFENHNQKILRNCRPGLLWECQFLRRGLKKGLKEEEVQVILINSRTTYWWADWSILGLSHNFRRVHEHPPSPFAIDVKTHLCVCVRSCVWRPLCNNRLVQPSCSAAHWNAQSRRVQQKIQQEI